MLTAARDLQAVLPTARAPTSSYARREPAATTLHAIVREHFATFQARCAERNDGRDVPTFVRRALLRYLDCGVARRARVELRRCHDACDGRQA